MVVMTDKEFVIRLAVIFSDVIKSKEQAGDLISKICVGFGFDDQRRSDILKISHEETHAMGLKIMEELKNGIQ